MELNEYYVLIAMFFIVIMLAILIFSGNESKSGRMGSKDVESVQRSLYEIINESDSPEPPRVIRIGKNDVLVLFEIIEEIKNFKKPINFSVNVNNKRFDIIIEDGDDKQNEKNN